MAYLSDVEHGRRLPAWPVLERIATLLGLDTLELAAEGGRLPPGIESYLLGRAGVLRLLDVMARAGLGPGEVERLRRAVERRLARAGDTTRDFCGDLGRKVPRNTPGGGCSRRFGRGKP